jgi:AhpD family alkylhydroperoxidase
MPSPTVSIAPTPTVRIAVDTLAPHINKAMNHLDAASRRVALAPALLDLVRARVSQLNGCAYCVDTHLRDARTGGDTERRLFALSVWRDTPFFDDRERAALDLAEAATRLTDGPFDETVVQRASAVFTQEELAELLWTIAVMNAWNRLGVVARPWPLV